MTTTVEPIGRCISCGATPDHPDDIGHLSRVGVWTCTACTDDADGITDVDVSDFLAIRASFLEALS